MIETPCTIAKPVKHCHNIKDISISEYKFSINYGRDYDETNDLDIHPVDSPETDSV